MITDLVQIHRLGTSKRAENERLRQHLKKYEFVERKLRRIAQDIEDQIDCTQCANCCRQATVRLQERDVEDIARFLRLSRADFIGRYASPDQDEGLILRRGPGGCVFLEGNLCSIYEHRPATCAGFPHLVKGAGSLQSRMWEMPDRACYCPIVYNALEVFKVEVDFHRKSARRK